MTTGYNIACALLLSLVSIPFYAIPLSLSIIHRIFLITSLLAFFAAFSKDVDTTVILSSHLESCYGKEASTTVYMHILLHGYCIYNPCVHSLDQFDYFIAH